MRLKAMAVIILRPDGQVQTATIDVSAESGESGRFSTNTDGVIMIEDPDAPGDFSDISVLQSFEVTLPADQNPDLFQAGAPGADLSAVYLIQLVLEYSYALQTNS